MVNVRYIRGKGANILEHITMNRTIICLQDECMFCSFHLMARRMW